VASRDVRLRETYGIDQAYYERLLARQDGRCGICQGTRRGNLDVDHDHALERELLASGVGKPEATRRSIRGLLCRRCNRRLLPSCRDDEQILLRAIEYLRFPPAQPGLTTTRTVQHG